MTGERRSEPVPLSPEVREHTLMAHAGCGRVARLDPCPCGCTIGVWCGRHHRYVALFAVQLPLCEHGRGMVELTDEDGEVQPP